MKDFSKENCIGLDYVSKKEQPNSLTLNLSLGQKRSIDSLSFPSSPTSTSSSKISRTSNVDKRKIVPAKILEKPIYINRSKSINENDNDDELKSNENKNQHFYGYGMKYDPILFNQYVHFLRVERVGGDEYDSDSDWALSSDDDDSCYSHFSSDDEDDDCPTLYECRDSQGIFGKNESTSNPQSSSNCRKNKTDLSINIGSLSITGQRQDTKSIFRVSNANDKKITSVIDQTRIFRRS